MSTRISRVMVVVFLVLLSLQSISFAATSNMRKKIPVTYRGIQVVVEGKVIAGEEPFIMDDNGIMMVPVRMVAEAVGKSVIWDGSKNIIYIGTAAYIKKNAVVSASILKPIQGKIIPVIYRDIQVFAGGKIIKSEEPFMLDGKDIVMVPIRAVAEATGKSVVWNSKNNIIEITTGKTPVISSKVEEFVNIEDMMVLRNVGSPFFRQNGEPFTIAAGNHNHGVGVRLKGGSAELVIRTHGKYKAIEGWLGVDDETSNTSGAFFLSIFTDSKSVLSDVELEGGGAEKIIDRIPNEYGYDYNLVQMGNGNKDTGGDGEKNSIYNNTYPVNSDLYEKTPIYICGPIFPASYPKYINPVSTNISGALTVMIRVTWVAGEQGDYPDLTAVLADFKFKK